MAPSYWLNLPSPPELNIGTRFGAARHQIGGRANEPPQDFRLIPMKVWPLDLNCVTILNKSPTLGERFCFGVRVVWRDGGESGAHSQGSHILPR
jgi:hypothetical protein